MQETIPEYTVSEISFAIKRTMEDAFARVRVRGEIFGCKRADSGHYYLSLKDENANLSAVCWKGVAAGLKVKPEDGLEVVAAGRITTFAGKSSYQLVIEQMEVAGAGALLKLLEERKQKFAAEGLFDPAHKKPIPFLPRIIGVVTSPAGAVIRDIIHRVTDRFPVRIIVWPTLVQGEGAAEQIAAAVNGFNRLPADGPVPRPDLLIVARGGGSLEDLWCFNEEDVATAIFSSKIPVLAGIGHEVDVTLADMTADVRAATPSHAAQLLWPLRREYWQRLDELSFALERARQGWLQRQEDRLQRCERALRLCSPARRLEGAALQWQQWQQRLLQAGERLLRDRELRLQHHQERLRALTGPGRLAHLQQRLALLEQKFGNAAHLMVRGREQVVRDCTRDLARLGQEAVSRRGHELECLELRLAACNPLAPLGRGYAVVRTAEGRVLSSTGQGSAGQDVRILLRDGELEARVTAVHPYDGQGGEHV